jgi:hypothetical protein
LSGAAATSEHSSFVSKTDKMSDTSFDHQRLLQGMLSVSLFMPSKVLSCLLAFYINLIFKIST